MNALQAPSAHLIRVMDFLASKQARADAEGNGVITHDPLRAVKFAGRMATGAIADVIEDPIETLLINPAKAIGKIPAEQKKSELAGGLALRSLIGGDKDKAKEFGFEAVKSVGRNSLNALEGSALFPPAKGASMLGAGARQGARQTAASQTAQRVARDPVMDALARMAKAEGVKPQELAQRAAMPAEDGAMVFQQLGLPQTAQGLGNRAGQSREIMQEAATKFQAGQGGRVEGIMKAALGNPDADMSIESIIAQARQKAAPSYKAAMDPSVKT